MSWDVMLLFALAGMFVVALPWLLEWSVNDRRLSCTSRGSRAGRKSLGLSEEEYARLMKKIR